MVEVVRLPPTEGTCKDCDRQLHVKDCPGCGRSCACYRGTDHADSNRVFQTEAKTPNEPLTAKWETDILRAFIQRHGARNVRQAVTRLEEQLG